MTDKNDKTTDVTILIIGFSKVPLGGASEGKDQLIMKE